MIFLLSSIALSFALQATANGIRPNVIPPLLAQQLFVDKNQNFCLSAAANLDGAAVSAAPCSNDPNIFWTVTNGGPGTGTITIFGDKCLDVTNGVNQDGTKLQIFTCNKGNKNQQWKVSNDLTINWFGTNKCVDNTNGALLAAGNPTQIWTCFAGNINQKWVPGDFNSVGVTPGETVNFLLPRKATNDFGCLTASSNADGAPVIFQACDFVNEPDSQNWIVTAGAPPETGTAKGPVGTITVFGDKCLDVTNGNTANGAKLQIFTCGAGNPNQQWLVNGDATIEWSGKGKCADLTNGVVTDGTPIQSFTCTPGNSNQEWFAFPL